MLTAQPHCPPPPLTPARPDESAGRLVLTPLQGAAVHAFDIGGEPRLCLPQVLHCVLLGDGVEIADVSAACDALGIACSRCSPAQLHALRMAIGHSLQTCGLITKSDAERLCKALLACTGPKYTPQIAYREALPVFHRCFGKQRGHLLPRLYNSPAAACIVCSGCRRLFSPAQFVGHCHGRLEPATCHWGFDSERWRCYLLLDNRHAAPGAEEALEAIKNRFCNANCDGPPAKRQRVEMDNCCQQQLQLQQQQLAMLSHPHFHPNIRLVASTSGKGQLRKAAGGLCCSKSHSHVEESIASDWESLTDWCEGHLPEKATPQFLEMVEQLKAEYRCYVSSLLGCIRSLRDQVSGSRDAQAAAEQLQQQQMPELQKLRVRCAAQAEEIKMLHSHLQHMRVQLTPGLGFGQLPHSNY